MLLFRLHPTSPMHYWIKHENKIGNLQMNTQSVCNMVHNAPSLSRDE